MSDDLMTQRPKSSRHTRRIVLLALCLPAACGQPFTTLDPPPTFAYRLAPANPIYAMRYFGSVLNWVYVVDLADPNFLPAGSSTPYPAQYSCSLPTWPAATVSRSTLWPRAQGHSVST
jgi:hypothetical protein